MVGPKKAFTLIELLVVIVIIAILAGMGVTGYNMARRDTKESRAKAEIEILRTALEEFRVEFGRYPESAGSIPIRDMVEGLSAEQAEVFSVEGVEFVDPWGNAYQYLYNGKFSCNVWSGGLDPTDDSDNIGSSKGAH